MTSVTPFLWFQTDASRALAKYSALFSGEDGVTIEVSPVGADETYTVGTLRVGDTEVMIFNGGPVEGFDFSPASSLFVVCDGQDDVDRYWAGLSENGRPSQCGWVTDEFGVTWQIVPQLFLDLMRDPDTERTSRVFNAMLTMTKFDCARLQSAYDGLEPSS